MITDQIEEARCLEDEFTAKRPLESDLGDEDTEFDAVDDYADSEELEPDMVDEGVSIIPKTPKPRFDLK